MADSLTRFIAGLDAERARASPQPERDEPEWLRGIERHLQIVAPPPAREMERLTVQEARARIRTGIRAYLAEENASEMLLVQAVAGVGKTTIAVLTCEEMVEQSRARVLYAGPRHDFFVDLMAIARHPDWWYEWLPRRDETDDHPANCQHFAAMNTWLAKGYKAMDFCQRVCGWDYVGRYCVYHAQRKRSEPIIYGMHEHVVLGHPFAFGVVVGDESPIAKVCHEWNIPAANVMVPGLAPDSRLAHLVHQLHTLASQGTTIRTDGLIALLGGAEAVARVCEEVDVPNAPQYVVPDISVPADVERAPYLHLFPLVTLLKRAAGVLVRGGQPADRLRLVGGALQMLLRRQLNERLPRRMVWLDATANARLYSAAFQRQVRVLDAQVQMRGRVIQVYDRANGKASLLEKDGTQTTRVGQAGVLVGEIVKRQGYKRPAVITFMGCQDAMGIEEVGHFYAARGTNQYEGCDALFVVGTPMPSPGSLLDQARMVFWDRDAEFTAPWITQIKQYRYVDPEDGQGRAYPVAGYWDDPDLSAILWSMREAEIIQTAHRVRPISVACDVWLLTNIPLDELPPDQLVSMRDCMGAPLGVNIFLWHRFMEAVEALVQEQGVATQAALAERMGASRPTIRKYTDALLATGEWIEGLIPRGKGGGSGARARGLSRG